MKNAITKEATMTTKEVAKALGITPRAVTGAAKKYLPNKKIENGKKTYWTEAEVTVLLEQMKENLPDNPRKTSNNLILGSTALSTQFVVQEKLKVAQQAFADIFSILQGENETLKERNANLEIALDESLEFASVKLMEKLNPTRKFDWRVLKRFSTENGIEIKKATDQNYGEVNSYHKTVWESCYELDETPWK